MVLTQNLLELAKKQPFKFAHIHGVTGEQRSGKNTFVVARVRDAYDKDCVRIYLREEKGLDFYVPSVYDNGVYNYDKVILSYDRYDRIARLRINGEKRNIRIPDSYQMHSPMKVYSVFHLFGIPCHYLTWIEVIEYLQLGAIKDAYLLLDQLEIISSARDGMSTVGKYIYKKQNQFGKDHLEVYILVPSSRHMDWTLRAAATEKIYCSRVSDYSNDIEVRIQRRGLKGTAKYIFDGSEYWKNFLTDEEIQIPEGQVQKALESLKLAVND